MILNLDIPVSVFVDTMATVVTKLIVDMKLENSGSDMIQLHYNVYGTASTVIYG